MKSVVANVEQDIPRRSRVVACSPDDMADVRTFTRHNRLRTAVTMLVRALALVLRAAGKRSLAPCLAAAAATAAALRLRRGQGTTVLRLGGPCDDQPPSLLLLFTSLSRRSKARVSLVQV